MRPQEHSSGFEAEWPAPPSVRTWVTTRSGGVSAPPYESLNLGTHVGDEEAQVVENRNRLQQQLQLAAEPQWLNQVHGTTVVELPFSPAVIPRADGCWTQQPQFPCAVLTADCLPILLTNRRGSQVAALHAGWRGLAAGVVAQGVQRFDDDRDQILAWIGPAIAQPSYEVGEEIREIFCQQDERAEGCFDPSEKGHWLASMVDLAKLRLQQIGVETVYGGGWDTGTDSDFFSYRRDGITGRFATLIWIE
ncbi:MAG: peptidoglycan editing factor PgeF [Gammaproteobacteria bacterium]|jgi:polyphenol oxidase|nr:peptidoglycan editing factor PgeF [Gammaproteobacteria bacterium]MBT4608161.1 peptidoglycan editing factor PgeF [Thiotrichales bacterium]MBT3471967.1 peptidoglycan editing factor PgeF [Gammaproteobacteria bacterium]MBT3965953.1 peptidoglycan editing factor PgeF [Gammaproteobacteria bacterium]MBT4080369.1 peptidoglycan editing factor PgeF [Gammaproteobacteria bacterium]